VTRSTYRIRVLAPPGGGGELGRAGDGAGEDYALEEGWERMVPLLSFEGWDGGMFKWMRWLDGIEISLICATCS